MLVWFLFWFKLGHKDLLTWWKTVLSLVINGTVHDLTPFTIRTTNKTGKSDFASSLFTDNLIAIRPWNAQTLGTSLIKLLDYFSILREISAPFVDRTSNARRIQEDFASAKCHPLQFVLLAKENKSPIRADRELPLFHDWAQNPWANVMRNDNAYNTIHAKPGFIHIFKKTIS